MIFSSFDITLFVWTKKLFLNLQKGDNLNVR